MVFILNAESSLDPVGGSKLREARNLLRRCRTRKKRAEARFEILEE
ncbi:MAG: hypothetical protein WAM90_01110 [Rhodanobacter sp.]